MKEKEKKNTSYILRRLEPSSELKRSVMERASKLEAGRKTFGEEKTTTDNRETNKERITMNANSTKQAAYVKKRFPVAVISAAACAALIIGVAAASMNKTKVDTLNESTSSLSSAVQTEVKDSSTSSEEDPIPNRGGSVFEDTDKLTVYYDNGLTFTQDEKYIPDIESMVEKIMQCPVLHGTELPSERTIVYYADGERQTVELCDESHPVRGSDYSAGTDRDLFLIVRVNGTQYGVDFNDPTLLLDLKCCTESDIPMTYEKKNGSRTVTVYNEAEEKKASELIADIRSSGTLISEEGSLPSADCDLSLSFDDEVKCFNIRVWENEEILETEMYGICGDEPHSAVYGSARRWIDELNGIVAELEEDTEPADWIESYYYGNNEVVGYIRIPGLTNADGMQYVNSPVTQHSDNEYYLDHDWTGDPFEAGSIFADSAEPITRDSKPDIITLYGKSKRELGSMFTHLTDLNDASGDRLNECSVIKFATTWDEGLSQYLIIGAGIIDTNSDSSFDYSGYRSFDSGRYTFESWLGGIKDNCRLIRDIDCTAEDEYLTLSTNIDEENADGFRFTVFARKLREGETYPSSRFTAVGESPIETEPVEDVRIPEITGMTEEQAAAALEGAGLRHVTEYSFSNEDKGTVIDYYAPYYLPDHVPSDEGTLVSRGAEITMIVSGGTDDLSLCTGFSEIEGEMMALRIPLPDGLSGHYIFNAFIPDTDYTYGYDIKEISGRKEFVLPLKGSGKHKVLIDGWYHKKNDLTPVGRFNYAEYEVDFDAHTCTLIGELGTDELMKAKQ